MKSTSWLSIAAGALFATGVSLTAEMNAGPSMIMASIAIFFAVLAMHKERAITTARNAREE